MKTVVFTKAEIIKALKTEKLTPGAFARPIEIESMTAAELAAAFDTTATKANCKVCAVGAILRNRFKSHSIEGLITLGRDVTDRRYAGFTSDFLLEEKNYLGALSCEFERLSCTRTDEAVVAILLEFVKTNFPTRFKVSLE